MSDLIATFDDQLKRRLGDLGIFAALRCHLSHSFALENVRTTSPMLSGLWNERHGPRSGHRETQASMAEMGSDATIPLRYRIQRFSAARAPFCNYLPGPNFLTRSPPRSQSSGSGHLNGTPDPTCSTGIIGMPAPWLPA